MLAGLLGLAALFVLFYGRQVAYTIVPPTPSQTATPTITFTPTITYTPSITSTASITPTPSITLTPSITPTPQLPEEISVLLRETITPDPGSIFSPIQVATQLNNSVQAVNPSEEFNLPLGRLYGAFSYNQMQDGVRWTAVWYRGSSIVCLETQEWDGGTGGFGYTECEPTDGWAPGDYEIQIFVGEEWKVSTRFTILSSSGTPTPDASVTPG